MTCRWRESTFLYSIPFLGRRTTDLSSAPVGLSVDNAMIGPAPSFVMEPTADVLALLSSLAGAQRLSSQVVGGPVMAPAPGQQVPVLQPVVALSRGHLELVVINVSPTDAVKATVRYRGLPSSADLTARLLDGPSPTAYNTLDQPDEVGITTLRGTVHNRGFEWTFPAHSVTLLELAGSWPNTSPPPTSIVAMGRPLPRKLR